MTRILALQKLQVVKVLDGVRVSCRNSTAEPATTCSTEANN